MSHDWPWSQYTTLHCFSQQHTTPRFTARWSFLYRAISNLWKLYFRGRFWAFVVLGQLVSPAYFKLIVSWFLASGTVFFATFGGRRGGDFSCNGGPGRPRSTLWRWARGSLFRSAFSSGGRRGNRFRRCWLVQPTCLASAQREPSLKESVRTSAPFQMAE